MMSGMILSHIPLHPESLGRFGTNIHGHLHANRVMMPGWTKKAGNTKVVDPRYWCACVEQLPDFAPILFEDAIKLIKAQGGEVDFRKNGNGPAM